MPMVDDHVRLDGAQDRQVAGGEGVVGPLHEGVAELLAAGAQVPGGPVGLHASTPAPPAPSPRRRRRVEAAGDAAVGVPGRTSATGPRWGRVRGRRGRAAPGSGAPPAPAPRTAGWRRPRPAPRRPRPGRRPAPAAAAPCSRARDRGDHRDLLGGDPARRRTPAATAGRCSSARPVRTSWPAAAGDSRGVPAQPGLHGLQPVVLGGLGELALADGAGDCGVEPVLRRAPAAPSGRAPAAPNIAVEVLGGEAVQGATRRSAQRHLPSRSNTCSNNTADTARRGQPNPQVRGLSTDSSTGLRDGAIRVTGIPHGASSADG